MTSGAARERPMIGVTAYDEEAAWGFWHKQASLVPAEYVRSLSSAGANPVVIPVQDEHETGLDSFVERFDGLLFTGGPDVDPARYGAEPHPRSQQPRYARDQQELALLAAAERSGLPVLAVCRGMQLLNVVRGGTLYQHLPDVVGHEDHNPTPGAFSKHLVRIGEGSQLHKALGWDERDVPTHHHQAIDRLAGGLDAVAWAEDGTIEGVEDPAKRFLIGVQWHAEADEDPALFESLVEAAEPGAVPEACGRAPAPRAVSAIGESGVIPSPVHLPAVAAAPTGVESGKEERPRPRLDAPEPDLVRPYLSSRRLLLAAFRPGPEDRGDRGADGGRCDRLPRRLHRATVPSGQHPREGSRPARGPPRPRHRSHRHHGLRRRSGLARSGRARPRACSYRWPCSCLPLSVRSGSTCSGWERRARSGSCAAFPCSCSETGRPPGRAC